MSNKKAKEKRQRETERKEKKKKNVVRCKKKVLPSIPVYS